MRSLCEEESHGGIGTRQIISFNSAAYHNGLSNTYGLSDYLFMKKINMRHEALPVLRGDDSGCCAGADFVTER